MGELMPLLPYGKSTLTAMYHLHCFCAQPEPLTAHWCTQDKPAAEDVDAASLARRTAGFSGAELANLVNEAALAAGKGGHARITAAMLDEAQDKILMGSERRCPCRACVSTAHSPRKQRNWAEICLYQCVRSMVRTAESLRRTAYHESGHALVAFHTAGAHPIHKATIVPRGHALGMVSQTPEKDEYSRTRQQMAAHIDVCMGGRVAEELIFGEEQVGALLGKIHRASHVHAHDTHPEADPCCR